MEQSKIAEEKIKHWLRATAKVDQARQELSVAEAQAKEATNTLGAFLVPEDGTPNEKFCIWVGDGLLEARVLDTIKKIFSVGVRTDGKTLDELSAAP